MKSLKSCSWKCWIGACGECTHLTLAPAKQALCCFKNLLNLINQRWKWAKSNKKWCLSWTTSAGCFPTEVLLCFGIQTEARFLRGGGIPPMTPSQFSPALLRTFPPFGNDGSWSVFGCILDGNVPNFEVLLWWHQILALSLMKTSFLPATTLLSSSFWKYQQPPDCCIVKTARTL